MKRFAVAMMFLLLLALPLLAQTPAPAQPAPSPFKNVEYLKGLNQLELVRAMQMMAASLGTNCGFCHVRKGEELDFAADDKPEKQTARHMIAMTEDLNARYFENHPVISCNSCHRGAEHPVNVVALPVAAVTAPEMDHDAKRPEMPTRDAVVAKYEAATGVLDAAKLASLTAKGTRESGNGQKSEFELQRANGSIRTQSGSNVSVVTPEGGWMADATHPAHAMMPVQRDSSRDVLAAYDVVTPHMIPANARVTRKDKVGDREAYVMSFNDRPGVRERLYFDAENGLLLRRMIFTATPIGEIPMQIDYSDYRDAGGVKLPFTVRLDPIDARQAATRHYSEIHVGAKVDEGVFGMPH